MMARKKMAKEFSVKKSQKLDNLLLEIKIQIYMIKKNTKQTNKTGKIKLLFISVF